MRTIFPNLRLLLLLAVGVGLMTQSAFLSQANAQVETDPASRNESSKADQRTGEFAQKLLSDAIVQLDRHKSVRTKLRHRVNLFDHQLFGSGIYLQQQQRFRMEMGVEIASGTKNFVQIGDGRFIWSYQQDKQQPTLSYVDLWRVKDELLAEEMQHVDASTRALALSGGLPRLLRALQTYFEITAIGEAKIGDVAIWRIHGRQRPAGAPDQVNLLDGIFPVQESEAGTVLESAIDLGKEDLFPYRIDLSRRDMNSPQKPAQSVAVLEFSEVVFNGLVEATQFIRPPEFPETDATDAFLSKFSPEESR